jgi:hypothetical protein
MLLDGAGESGETKNTADELRDLPACAAFERRWQARHHLIGVLPRERDDRHVLDVRMDGSSSSLWSTANSPQHLLMRGSNTP